MMKKVSKAIKYKWLDSTYISTASCFISYFLLQAIAVVISFNFLIFVSSLKWMKGKKKNYVRNIARFLWIQRCRKLYF